MMGGPSTSSNHERPKSLLAPNGGTCPHNLGHSEYASSSHKYGVKLPRSRMTSLCARWKGAKGSDGPGTSSDKHHI
eukprot:1200540-Pyramimonas_sp.AAC.1